MHYIRHKPYHGGSLPSSPTTCAQILRSTLTVTTAHAIRWHPSASVYKCEASHSRRCPTYCRQISPSTENLSPSENYQSHLHRGWPQDFQFEPTTSRRSWTAQGAVLNTVAIIAGRIFEKSRRPQSYNSAAPLGMDVVLARDQLARRIYAARHDASALVPANGRIFAAGDLAMTIIKLNISI